MRRPLRKLSESGAYRFLVETLTYCYVVVPEESDIMYCTPLAYKCSVARYFILAAQRS